MSSPRSWKTVADIGLLTGGHFLSDFYATFLPALIPLFVAEKGLSLTLAGMLAMAYSFTSNILQPLFGYCVDKSGYAWLVLTTIPVSALFICYSPLTPNLILLFVFVVAAGLGSSLYHPLGSSLVGKVAPAERKGLAMSVFIAGGNFGVAAGPATVIYVLVHYGVEAMQWLIIPGLILTAAFWQAGLNHINLANPNLKSMVQAGAWYKSCDLLKLNAVMGLRSWVQAAIPTFLSVWLVRQGESTTLAGVMLTVFLLGGAFGSFAGGFMGDRFGHKRCIMGSLLVCLPTMYLFLTGGQITTLTFVWLAISGGALQNTLPSSIVWAQRIFPANAAMTSGMMMGLSFGLGGLGAAITGSLADMIGLQAALEWTLLPLTLAILIAWSIPEPSSHAVGAETTL